MIKFKIKKRNQYFIPIIPVMTILMIAQPTWSLPSNYSPIDGENLLTDLNGEVEEYDQFDGYFLFLYYISLNCEECDVMMQNTVEISQREDVWIIFVYPFETDLDELFDYWIDVVLVEIFLEVDFELVYLDGGIIRRCFGVFRPSCYDVLSGQIGIIDPSMTTSLTIFDKDVKKLQKFGPSVTLDQVSEVLEDEEFNNTPGGINPGSNGLFVVGLTSVIIILAIIIKKSISNSDKVKAVRDNSIQLKIAQAQVKGYNSDEFEN